MITRASRIAPKEANEGAQPKNSEIAITTMICGTVFTAAIIMLAMGNISRGR